MGKRHETIGIKQAIRIEWMQKAANLLLAGLDVKSTRQELHAFLKARKDKGNERNQSDQTRSFAVTALMHAWVTPERELVPFRDSVLKQLQDHPDMSLAAHWVMMAAAYPFWFNVARQTGRLLTLQDQVTHAQILTRLKEQYGDRQTVNRCAQYVIRSFVTWGVLKDSNCKGCYEKVAPVPVGKLNTAIILYESALHATEHGKLSMSQLLTHPALFPFQMPPMTGEFIGLENERIEVMRLGYDEELVRIVK